MRNLLFKILDVDQLNQILGILGTPDEETLRRVGSERVNGDSMTAFFFYFKYNLRCSK